MIQMIKRYKIPLHQRFAFRKIKFWSLIIVIYRPDLAIKVRKMG